MSEQYDEQASEQDELAVEDAVTTEDAADVEETTDQPETQTETESGLEPGESPAAELEDQYGEPNDGPEVEDDPRLDTEVTDETTDLEMGLDDTKAADDADVELSEEVAAELADDPADSSDDEPVSAEVAEVEVDEVDAEDSDEDPTRPTTRPATSLSRPTRSRSSAPSCGPSRVTGSWCTPTPAWRTG